jgi:hypothetical protein
LLIQVALFALTGRLEMSVLKMLLAGNSAQLVPGSGCADAAMGLVVTTARPARQPTARHATTRVFLFDTKFGNAVEAFILRLTAPSLQRVRAAVGSHPGDGGLTLCRRKLEFDPAAPDARGFARMVPVSRSMSLHLRPRASPRRTPSAWATCHRASSRSPLDGSLFETHSPRPASGARQRRPVSRLQLE